MSRDHYKGVPKKRALVLNAAGEAEPLSLNPLESEQFDLDGGSSRVFYYDAAATPTANIYNDWETMMSAVTTVSGLKTIQFGSNATIPSGTWDMNGVRWLGAISSVGGDNYPRVSISDGASFPFLQHITGIDVINNATSASPVNLLPKQQMLLDGGTQLGIGAGQQGVATVPFIETTGIFSTITLRNNAALGEYGSPATTPAIRINTGSVCIVYVHDTSTAFGTNVLQCDGTTFLSASPTANLQEGQVTGAGLAVTLDDLHTNYRNHFDGSLNTSTTRTAELGVIHRQNTTAASHTVTLPTTTAISLGKELVVKNEVGSNNVTVQPQSGGDLNSVTDGTVVLGAGESAKFVAVGDNDWVSV